MFDLGLNVARTNPLDDEEIWLRHPAFEAPLTQKEHAAVQADIDSIVGTTRDNKSIAVLVWNGDVNYWKEFFDDWDSTGEVVGGIKRRPRVLHKTIVDSAGRIVRDSFPPRYLLLTRLEREQYFDGWKHSTEFWEPTRQRWVRYRPETPPENEYLWFKTIALHNGFCCQTAAKYETDCYGSSYVHPRYCLKELRDIRRGIEESGIKENDPFATPDQVTRRVRENMSNNYEEQAMNKFNAQASVLAVDAPLAFASNKLLEEGASRKKIMEFAAERIKRTSDRLEKSLRQKTSRRG